MFLDDFEALLAVCFAHGGVFEELGDASRDSDGIAGLAEVAVFVGTNELADGTSADGNGGEAGGEGFHQDDALGFGFASDGEDVEGAIDDGEVVADDFAEEEDFVGDAEVFG